jgi:hypothetical protein
MIRFLLLNIRKPIAVLLLWLFLIAPLMGQSLLVESAATTVVIKRDNLVKAKADALKDAKGQSVMQAVERLLDYNSIDSLKPLLQKIFFEKPDNFIESIRVISEGSTHDLSEFIISIEARIFKSQLLAAFRKLGVPTKNERISFRDYFLIYNADQELRESEVLNLFLEQVRTRLNPYRIRIKEILVSEDYLTFEAGLPARIKLLADKTMQEIDINSLPLLELKLHIIADENNSQNYNLNTDLIFWSPQTDLKESSNSSIRASTMMSYTAGQIEAIIPSILDKLLLNWTPLIQKALTIYAGTGLEVKLKFKGISGPIQEQQLIKTLFQNNPRWKNLRLDVISENYVSYGALFIGKKDDIFQEFIPPPDAPFKISYLNWDENMLFVNVEWNERPASLEPFFELVQESDFFESESEEINLPVPELQVPLSPFKQTYSLPLASTVYDNIRHRGDSTLFMIKTYEEDGSKDESKSIKITWNRLGPTQLRPKLTLYDQNRKRLKTYLLKRKKQFSFKYKLPADRNAIYLRISDEIGFLNGVAGSYQSFRYILIAN